jgi:hypothetical protein
MTAIAHALAPDTRALLDREIDDLLLDARGLALVRDLLEERGATTGEIASHVRALNRVRARLVELLSARR